MYMNIHKASKYYINKKLKNAPCITQLSNVNKTRELIQTIADHNVQTVLWGGIAFSWGLYNDGSLMSGGGGGDVVYFLLVCGTFHAQMTTLH